MTRIEGKKTGVGRRTRGRPPADEEMRRSQLLQAATKVFLSKGFHQSRIEDIVTEAGTGKGTFYVHFKSKEEVFSALIEQFFRELQATLLWVQQNVSSAASLQNLFRDEAKLIFESLKRNRQLSLLFLREANSSSPQVQERVLSMYEELVRVSTETFQFATALGLLPRFDERVVSICILGAIEKLYHFWLSDALNQDEDKVLTEALLFLQRGCGLNT